MHVDVVAQHREEVEDIELHESRVEDLVEIVLRKPVLEHRTGCAPLGEEPPQGLSCALRQALHHIVAVHDIYKMQNAKETLKCIR